MKHNWYKERLIILSFSNVPSPALPRKLGGSWIAITYELQTGTIYSFPDFREGWGGYFIKILNSLLLFSFQRTILISEMLYMYYNGLTICSYSISYRSGSFEITSKINRIVSNLLKRKSVVQSDIIKLNGEAENRKE